MKHTATLKEHELTWNMMNQVWELTAIIEIDGKDMQLYVPLSEYPRRKYIKLYEENQQLKEEIKMLKEVIYDLDGLECPKCGNYHRRGWTCSQCGYGK